MPRACLALGVPSPHKLRIALLGTRGIPANYSGFETAVEHLGTRLAARGHSVTVYCRSHFQAESRTEYRGVRLVTLPTLANKYLDTMVHTTLSSLHALTQRYDAAVYFIAGNAPVAWIPRLAGTRTAINVDGLDWRRKKWPALAKAFIKWCERISRHTANRVITDSRAVVDFYRQAYGFAPDFIPYGSEIAKRPPGDVLRQFGLEPGRYVLFVGRLVPENCIDHLVDAYAGLRTDMPCVIVGDAPYADEYKARLHATSDPRIRFTGYVFGAGYQELGSNAYCFVETSEVGGTHPALLEAMAMGAAVIVNDTPENRETIADAGLAYDGAGGADALRPVLQGLLDNRARRDALALAAETRAAETYSWEAVTDQYESLCQELCGR
jgi:glycosyltransferase involved in cell wall biosynthesis